MLEQGQDIRLLRRWANLKPGAKSFYSVSDVDAGAQGIVPPLTGFSGLEAKQVVLKLVPYGMPALQAVSFLAMPHGSLLGDSTLFSPKGRE